MLLPKDVTNNRQRLVIHDGLFDRKSNGILVL